MDHQNMASGNARVELDDSQRQEPVDEEEEEEVDNPQMRIIDHNVERL